MITSPTAQISDLSSNLRFEVLVIIGCHLPKIINKRKIDLSQQIEQEASKIIADDPVSTFEEGS